MKTHLLTMCLALGAAQLASLGTVRAASDDPGMPHLETRRGAPGADGAPPPDPFAQTYAILDYLAPVILENQGRGTMVSFQPTNDMKSARQAARPADDTNAPTAAPAPGPTDQTLKMGDYTLNIRFGAGGSVGAAGAPGGDRRGGGGARGGGGGGVANTSPARFVINSGPGEYWFVGGPIERHLHAQLA